MTWMCVPGLVGSPNLAEKQENHLESLLEKGGLYSVLGKLTLAAGWIVYHTVVPLFLDVSWASVLTEGEWQYWSRDSSIKHGREGKAEDSSWLKGDSTLRFSSLPLPQTFPWNPSPTQEAWGWQSHLWPFLLIVCTCCWEIWSETRHHPYRWPQGNSITNNCWKACPVNSAKGSLCYCPPCFPFGLFPAILPTWLSHIGLFSSFQWGG